jgi:hypothetical protein
LDTGEPAKEILALKNFGGYSGADADQKLLDFAKKSRGHALALASNSRRDWSLTSFSERLLSEAFPYVKGQRGRFRSENQPSDWERLVSEAVANPSFDLATIAHLIRGEGLFSEIPVEARSEVGDEAMFWLYHHSKKTKKTKGIIAPGPSVYEMDIGKPAQALFSLVKSGGYTGHFNFSLEALLVSGAFRISQDDWLDESEKAKNFTERENLALGRFVRWFADYAADEPLDLDDASGHQGQELFLKGNVAVVAIMCALREMTPEYRREVLIELRDSSNWVARAAYYGNEIIIFSNPDGDAHTKKKTTKELTKALETDDLAFMRGVYSYRPLTKLIDLRRLPPGLGRSKLKLPDGAASQAFFSNLARLPGSQHEEDTTTLGVGEEVYEIENLLSAIQTTERTARFQPFVILGGAAVFLWLNGGMEEIEAMLWVLLFITAFFFREPLNLKVMNFKAELREVIRHGPTQYSSALVQAHEKVNKRKRRAFWPFSKRT